MTAQVAAPPAVRVSSWRTVNISPVERSGRVLLGLAAAITGIVLLLGAGSVLAVVLEALLIAAGADLMVTGALGHCPLYAKLGHTPTSLRAPR
jgi:hypothetical protein